MRPVVTSFVVSLLWRSTSKGARHHLHQHYLQLPCKPTAPGAHSSARKVGRHQSDDSALCQPPTTEQSATFRAASTRQSTAAQFAHGCSTTTTTTTSQIVLSGWDGQQADYDGKAAISRACSFTGGHQQQHQQYCLLRLRLHRRHEANHIVIRFSCC